VHTNIHIVLSLQPDGGVRLFTNSRIEGADEFPKKSLKKNTATTIKPMEFAHAKTPRRQAKPLR
jgi:hypothetical protein